MIVRAADECDKRAELFLATREPGGRAGDRTQARGQLADHALPTLAAGELGISRDDKAVLLDDVLKAPLAQLGREIDQVRR